MNIAIVGGGIVGLALGYKLSKIKGNRKSDVKTVWKTHL